MSKQDEGKLSDREEQLLPTPWYESDPAAFKLQKNLTCRQKLAQTVL